jgi:hypothetical protein
MMRKRMEQASRLKVSARANRPGGRRWLLRRNVRFQGEVEWIAVAKLYTKEKGRCVRHQSTLLDSTHLTLQQTIEIR